MSLLSVEDALARLLADVEPVRETETLPLSEVAERVLAEDVTASRTQTDFDASAMDGYAVRAEDLAEPGRSVVLVGESAAGRAFSGSIGRGQTVRIFTGAPLPAGADAVLIQEDADRTEGSDRVTTRVPVPVGAHIRRRGNDFSEGNRLVAAGSLLTAGQVAIAASGGHPELKVRRRPKVAILATGDELVRPGETVGPAQIVASNSYGVAAIARAAGAAAFDYGIAPDDEGAIAGAVDRAVLEDIDVLVTIGGASVGDHDLVGRVFEERNVALDFWRVAMRPGKPIMAGRLGAMRLIGLPGNPASSMVAATLFLRPLLRRLAGRPETAARRAGVLGRDMSANDHRAEFVRASIEYGTDGIAVLKPLGRQDSSLLSIYAAADALLVRPANAPAARSGERCEFLLLD